MLFNSIALRPALLTLALVSASMNTAVADDVADFYRGRTVTFLSGGEPGGAYDLYMRLLARHIVRFIPGNPRVAMQYMPGAGSVIATNYAFNLAPQDGTVILAPGRTAALAPYLGHKGARFDSAQINWLGSLNNEVGVMQVWGTQAVKTLPDARRSRVIVGSTSPLTDSEEYPTLLNNTLGTKFQLVRGYKSIEAVQMALERGEIEGQQNSYFGMAQHFPDWRSRMSILVQLSRKKHPAIPEVPLVFEFIKPEFIVNGLSVEEVEAFWQVILSQQVNGRPYAVGPKVPSERVTALRAAFKSTIEDAQFRADMQNSRLEFAPSEGAEIQRMIGNIAAVPASVLAHLRELIVYKGD